MSRVAIRIAGIGMIDIATTTVFFKNRDHILAQLFAERLRNVERIIGASFLPSHSIEMQCEIAEHRSGLTGKVANCEQGDIGVDRPRSA